MAHIFWACITSCLRKAPVEIETVRLDGKPGKWFLATISVSGTDIVVTPATVHTPSCSIKSSRRITQNEFCTVFPHFFTWLRRIEQRKKIRNYGQNTSYIFALIAHFLVVCLVAKLKSSSVPCRTILQRLIDWIIAEILELSEITDATQTNNLCKEAQIASVLSNTSIPAPCGNGAVYGKFLQYETKEKTINFWIGLPDEANDPNVYLWFLGTSKNRYFFGLFYILLRL